MRFAATTLALLAFAAGSASAVVVPQLVISPHGRGTSARANERTWGDLPGLGHFAVVNPAGEGRRLGEYSWGDPGQIRDLARMPAILRARGVAVDSRRIYALGGSMGGQETLLLLARYPHLLAGAAAFDPSTNMARRYWDFAKLTGGRTLQWLARKEIGGTPLTDPAAYAARSPDTYALEIAHRRRKAPCQGTRAKHVCPSAWAALSAPNSSRARQSALALYAYS